jgi:hypothetical protein
MDAKEAAVQQCSSAAVQQQAKAKAKPALQWAEAAANKKCGNAEHTSTVPHQKPLARVRQQNGGGGGSRRRMRRRRRRRLHERLLVAFAVVRQL